MVGTRTLSLKLLIGTIVLLAFASSQAASFGSGITYTGRIVKDENPIDSGTVRFFVWIQTQGGCDLYAEQRDVDMTGASGTYSFEIGTGAMASSFPHTSFGIKTIADVFDNTKKTSDLDTSRTGCLTFTPNADEGRVMKVQFIPPGEVVAQALPDLVLTAVPTAQIAFNANKVNGYGTGDLLKVDPSYTAKTTANSPLTAAQYEEFWKLILGTSTNYLKAIPTLGGDVTGTLPAMTVVKIQNIAVTAPTTGDTGKVLTYNGTGMVWSAAVVGGITSLNGLSGATQSFVSGTTPLTISSSSSVHIFNISDAGASSSGLLTQTDWNTFNSKQSSSLGSGQIWVGNASGAAVARTLTGDVSVDNSGMTALKAVGTAGTYAKVVTDAQGRVVSGSAITASDLPTLADTKIWIGNSSGAAEAYAMSGDASMSNSGLLTLKNTGTAGTYSKVVTDAQGRVVSGSGLASSDVTTALGYTPVNRAGDTMSGALNMGANDLSNAGNISMAANKYFGLSANGTDGTVAGQVWYDSGVIKYFDGTSARTLGVSGSGITSINGLTSGVQSFVIGASGTAPAFSSAGSAHTLNIPMASASSVTAGLISNADYASMMAKQSNSLAAGEMWVGNASGVAQAFPLSGDVASVSNTGAVVVNKTTTGANNTILSLDGTGVANAYGFGVKGATSGTVTLQAATTTANYSLKLPATTPTANQVMQSDASGNLSWATTLTSSSGYINGGNSFTGNATIGLNDAYNLGIKTNNTTRMTVTGAGGVGIGTTSPSGALDVVGSSASDVYLNLKNNNASGFSTFALNNDTGTVAEMFVNGSSNSTGAGVNSLALGTFVNSPMAFYTNGTEKMRVTSGGNIGVGTVSPISKVHVHSTANGDNAVSVSVAGSGNAERAKVDLVTLSDANALGSTSNNRGWSIMAYGNGYGTSDANDLDFSYWGGATWAQGLRLDQTGKVGIGTSNPQYSLDFNGRTDAIRLPAGNASQQPSNAAGLIRYNTTNSNVEFNNGSGWNVLSSGSGSGYVNGGNSFAGNATIGLNDAYNLSIKTNNLTRMTFLNNGNVGIGTTTPTSMLTVENTGDSDGSYESLKIINKSAGTSAAVGVSVANNLGVIGNISTTSSTYAWSHFQSRLLVYADPTNAKGVSIFAPGATSDIRFYTSSETAERMRIDSNGRVGIGSAPNVSLDVGSLTDAIRMPVGNTSQRPSNATGLIRYNTTTGFVEYNNGSGWQSVASSTGSMTNTLAAGQMWVGNASGVAQAFVLSGDVSSVSNTGSVTVNKTTTGTSSTILSLDGSGVANAYGVGIKGTTSGSVTLQAAATTANYSLKLPSTTPVVNQVMQSDASGNLSWVTALTSSSGYINGGNSFAGNATIGLNDAYNLGFETNNTTRMTLDSSGNFGVGTSTPQSLLDVASNATVRAVSTGQCNEGLSLTRPTTAIYNWISWHTGTTSAQAPTCSDWDFMFGTQSGSTDLVIAGANTSGSPLVRTDGIVQFGRSGDVYFGRKIGIGTTSPSVAIDAGSKTDAIRVPVGNTSQRPANATGLIRYNTSLNMLEYNDGSGWNSVSSSANNIIKDGNSFGAHLIIGTNDNYDFRFETNGVTAMTIEPSGEVGIGTTTPGYKLDIVSTDGSVLRGNTYSSTNSQGSNLMLYRARGTASAPTAALANDTLGGVYSRGYGATGFGSNSTSYIEMSAAQNFTDTNRGSFMTFFTTPNNSATPVESMRIAQNGNVGIGTNNPGFTLEVASSAVDINNANMQVTNTAATNTWTPVIAAAAPYAVDGAIVQVVYGVGPQNGNRVEEGFVYHGDGDANNAYSLGFYGKNDLVTVLYGGNIGLGTATPVAGVQIGENAPSTDPRQLFFGESKISGTQRPQIVGQWNSGGAWGMGPSTTATNDYRVKIGYVNGTNSDWDTSQKISLDVDGPVVSTPQAVTGATVNLAASNTITISAIGSSTITLQNMVHGGNYTLLVSDTTSRTYTFSGCNTSKFKPANTATVSGTSTMYNIITVYNGSTYDCWITWASGYQ